MDVSPLCHKVASQTVVAGQGGFAQRLWIMHYAACSVDATPNLSRYVASLGTVPPPQKTFNRGTYRLNGALMTEHGKTWR